MTMHVREKDKTIHSFQFVTHLSHHCLAIKTRKTVPAAPSLPYFACKPLIRSTSTPHGLLPTMSYGKACQTGIFLLLPPRRRETVEASQWLSRSSSGSLS